MINPPVGPTPQHHDGIGIADQADFLNSVLESSTEYSIVAQELQGRILRWNEGARRIYGYEPGDVIGKSAFLLHHPDDVKAGRAQQILDEVRANRIWSGPLIRVRKNGSQFRAWVTITRRSHAGAGLRVHDDLARHHAIRSNGA